MEKNKAGLALLNCAGRKDILDRITQMDGSSIQIDVLDGIDEALKLVAGLTPSRKTILIFKVGSKKDLTGAVVVLKAAKSQIASMNLRPMALLTVESLKVEELLIENGCREIFSGAVDLEKFFKKLNYWLGSYSRQRAEVKAEKEDAADFLFESEENLEVEVDKILQKHNVPVQEEDLAFKRNMEVFLREKNVVSGVNVESGVMETKVSMEDSTGVSSVMSCNLENFEKNMMDIEIQSEEDISKKSSVNVSVKFIYEGCSVDIMTSGSIESFEEVDDGNYILNVKLLKDESQKIENFMALFQKRQDEIDKFMQAAQGKDWEEFEEGA